MQPSKHTALILKDWNYTVGEIETPVPGKGELLIKVQTAALNPADWKIPKYKLERLVKLPAILGSDIAGDVEKVGEGVSGFEVGDRVFCTGENWKDRGGYQQYVLIKADIIEKIPDNLSYDEAATLPLAIATAYSGLYAQLPHGIGLVPPANKDGYKKYTESPIVIIGGASAVGQAVIQLAKLSGFSPIITTGSLANEEALKGIGATYVLDRNLTPAVAVAAITTIAAKAILHVYDAVCSDSTQQLAMDILADEGRAAFPTPIITAKSSKKVYTAQVFAAARAPFNYEIFKELYYEKLYGWLEKGLIVPNRYEVLPGGLKGVEGGLKRLEADAISRLKLLVHPQET
ncbi:GroES-like protein, partial [Agrocybe pediades]